MLDLPGLADIDASKEVDDGAVISLALLASLTVVAGSFFSFFAVENGLQVSIDLIEYNSQETSYFVAHIEMQRLLDSLLLQISSLVFLHSALFSRSWISIRKRSPLKRLYKHH